MISDQDLRIVVQYVLPIFFNNDISLQLFDTNTFSEVVNIRIRKAQHIFKELVQEKIIEPIPDDIIKNVLRNITYIYKGRPLWDKRFIPNKKFFYTLTRYGAELLTDFIEVHVANSDEFPVQSALNRCVLDLNKAREDPNTIVVDYAASRLIAVWRKENVKNVIRDEDVMFYTLTGANIDLYNQPSPDFLVIDNQEIGIFVYLLYKDNLAQIAESAAKVKEKFDTAIWPANPSYKIEDILRYKSAFTFIVDINEKLDINFIKIEKEEKK